MWQFNCHVVSIATRIFLAISDIIVLVTVCVKTRYTLKKDASLSHIRTPVSVALLRDGTAYFM
ncbi:hypothetical protein OBBRIDRAFT_799301 [Obba rivulosa]|uniref:Uncharacterized protein n=1 Tax=Obba rivulosa TaxID=1052685 RepID=A0A8E2AGR5_9APHY|nr:hypothetical protein OBBRIDRAFT_799301 [Obba rivulosa]